jgi:diguanylate cyclase (GGDEF)-like protein/PAS domain S-box-containing protein
MKPSRRSRNGLRGTDLFRFASPFLYGTLLLYAALTCAMHQPGPGAIAVAASVGLALLLGRALFRAVPWANGVDVTIPRNQLLVEMLAVIALVTVMALQQSVPLTPQPWLITAAALFPLVLEFGVGTAMVVFLWLIHVGINFYVSRSPAILLAGSVATLSAGILSIILANALRANAKTLNRARTVDRRFNAIARATRHVFLIADRHFMVKYANPAVQEVLGFTPAELENGAYQPTIHPDDFASYWEKLRYLRNKTGGKVFLRHRTRHKEGHWVWLETRAYNMLNDPALNGLVFSIEDISARKNAETQLEEEHALLRAVLDLNPSMIYAKDTEGRFTISNASYQRRWGFSSEEELRGMTVMDILQRQSNGRRDLTTDRAGDNASGKAGEVAIGEAGDGASGRSPNRATGIDRDDRVSDDRISNALAAVNKGSGDSVDRGEALHRQDLGVISSGLPQEDLESRALWGGDSGRWYRADKYPLRGPRGDVGGMLGIIRDVTDRKEYEMRLEHQAMHDPLTGLANRRYLLTSLAARMDRSPVADRGLAVMFCDLDFFKSVNDSHGHDVGDKCLLELTRRLQQHLPEPDFVARFGGDEFIILVDGTLAAATRKAEALLTALDEPIVSGDVVVKIRISIGIAMLTGQHRSPSDLIRDADTAMHEAKDRGRNRIEAFDETLQQSTQRRAQLDVALRFAVERNQLFALYQPKVCMTDGRLLGFELLLRWKHPEYGEISPAEFIPIAESSGLIVPIGLWALEQACRQLQAWQTHHVVARNMTVAVNVSMRQLLHTSFLADVAEIFQLTGVAPESIELELTESSAMADPGQTIANLSLLKRLGLRLALDDFGTGYSSLAWLQKLPIDVLKIDKAFVHGLGRNHGDAEIVRLILALARTLNLEAIAEGVETSLQIEALMEMGCTFGQGFYFSRPIPVSAVEALLQCGRPFSLTDQVDKPVSLLK